VKIITSLTRFQISDFRRDVDDFRAVMRYYAALNGNTYRSFEKTYRPIKGQEFQELLILEDGAHSCSETSIKIYHSMLRIIV